MAPRGRGRALPDALDAAQAEGEELFRLRGGAGPVFGRLQVALAGRAPEDGELVVLVVVGKREGRSGLLRKRERERKRERRSRAS